MMVAIGYSGLAWLPPFLLTASAMQFGGNRGYSWWAAVINPNIPLASLLGALALWTLAVFTYVGAPSRERPAG
jgi:hypothetical protein